MPPKRQRKKDARGATEGGKKTLVKTKGAALCGIITPGPVYQLKTLVGYKGHCISKFQNPAYTFGRTRRTIEAEGPGPKYMITERRPEGFTFGHAVKRHDITFGPGPYLLPDVPRGPFFSLKWRTKPRKGIDTPGPYYIKSVVDAPAFSIGLRTAGPKPVVSAGPYPPYTLDAIKSRAPMYTIARRQAIRMISHSPGPIYAIKLPKSTPAFSFGVKHSECAPPYVTECDEQC